jgi:hypothetical protein
MSCACTGAFQLRNMPCGRWSDDWVSSNVLKTGKLCAVPGVTHHAGLIPVAAMPRAKSAEQCDAKDACENLGGRFSQAQRVRTGYFMCGLAFLCFICRGLSTSFCALYSRVLLCSRIAMSESDCSLFCADNGMPATTYFIRKITTQNALAS